MSVQDAETEQIVDWSHRNRAGKWTGFTGTGQLVSVSLNVIFVVTDEDNNWTPI